MEHGRGQGQSLDLDNELQAAAGPSFTAAQELASAQIVQPAWVWPFAEDAMPQPLPPGTLPEVQLEHFHAYLANVGRHLEALGRAAASHSCLAHQQAGGVKEGEGLVAAMHHVPLLFFREGFEVDQPEVWAAVDVTSEEGRHKALERLSAHLEAVEGHLVGEIAARYDSFFDASSYIQDMRRSVVALFEQVAAMRAKMHFLAQETGVAMVRSAYLQRQRANLLATLAVVQAVESVAQAQAALQGLLRPQGGDAGHGSTGSSAPLATLDYCGAIDVLEVLQGVLDNEQLLGLNCFRQLPEQLVDAAQAVDDLMMSDFLECGRWAAEGVGVARAADRVSAQLATAASTLHSHAPGQQRSAWLSSTEGETDGDAVVIADRLLDAVGLERAGTWLAGCLPAVEPPLQEALLPLVLGLQRMGRLSAAMHDLQANSKRRMRELVRDTVDACLAAMASPPSEDASHLTAWQDGRAAEDGSGGLAQLPGDQLQGVLQAVLLVGSAFLAHVQGFCAVVSWLLCSASPTTQQVESLQHDCRECSQAVAEVLVACWAKLLMARAQASTPAALRLHELSEVLATTEVMIGLVQPQGARSLSGLRSATCQLALTSLEGMHQCTLGKLTGLLEQETWASVEVHPDFQRLVDELQAAHSQQPSQVHSQQPEQPEHQRWSSTEQHQDNRQAAGAGHTPGIPPAGVAATAAATVAHGVGPVLQEPAAAVAPQMHKGANDRANADGIPAAGAVPRKFTITVPPESPLPAAHTSQQHAAQQHAPLLIVGSQRFHVVNTQLVLLRQLTDYLAFGWCVPWLASEVAQRALEVLKLFNSRTCQLVLGAGAMQVSSMKSITAKHLALSCQCLSAYIALHPSLVTAFLGGVAPPRHAMLAADFERTLQDYIIHRDEILSKLVSIMRERLSANIRQLPALAEAWPTGPAGPTSPPPSSFAITNIKQLAILSSVLSPLLLPEELHSIFSRVQLMFSCTLAEAYNLLEPQGPAWEQQLSSDISALLECLRGLPADPREVGTNLEQLMARLEASGGSTQVVPTAVPLAVPSIVLAQAEASGGRTAGGTAAALAPELAASSQQQHQQQPREAPP